jgi:hypothetical protein
LLGCYKNFPKNIHGTILFEYQDPAKSETFELDAVTPYLKQNCVVGFEFGVADDFDFNFLDNNELDKCLKCVDEKELETLDFFFAVRYHLIREDGERVPLRFDYDVLRFAFQEGGLELRIRHEKGTQHVQLDDLTAFLVKQINAELSRRQLSSLVLGNFEKVNVK